MPFSEILWPAFSVFLGICVAAQFVLIRSVNQRFARQSAMMRQLFNGPNGEDLEALFNRQTDEIAAATCNSQKALEMMEAMNGQFSDCVQHFSLVRYDAFDDVTGQMSFSLALLDGNGNGSILTSIFGRTTSRCFGKTVFAGQPEQTLSEEEQQALCEALKNRVKTDLNAKNAVILQNGNANGHLNGVELVSP